LSDGNHPTIDELLDWIAVESQLEVQAAGVELHQPPCQSKRLDGLRGIAGVFDRRGQNAPATRHSRNGDDAVAEGLQIVPVDARSATVRASQESAIRKADKRQPAGLVHRQENQLGCPFAPGAIGPFGYDSYPQTHEPVYAFTIARYRGLDGRVEAVVGDREGWSITAVAVGGDRILAGEGADIRLRCARAAPDGVRAEDVGVHEPRGGIGVVGVRTVARIGTHAASPSTAAAETRRDGPDEADGSGFASLLDASSRRPGIRRTGGCARRGGKPAGHFATVGAERAKRRRSFAMSHGRQSASRRSRFGTPS
jgi:hypothetical protein